MSFKKDTKQPMTKTVFPDKPRDPQPRRFLSNEEMSARRAKGLCYFCDEQYTPEHYKTHKKSQLFVLELDAEEDGLKIQEIEEENQEHVGEIAQISIHDMSGISTDNTMRVKAVHKKRSLFVLLDSGSIHNFLDPQVAAKLGCPLFSPDNARVLVVDGDKMRVQAKIEQLEWDFHGTSFVADFMVIPLTGIDAVLGVQWLQTLGPITWDFKQLTMKFTVGPKRVMLHGIHPDSVRAVKVEKLNKIKAEAIQLSMLCVSYEEDASALSLSALTTESLPSQQDVSIDKLLGEYPDVFAEPTGLPPFRDHHNHKISLMEGSNPVNLRPYRYAVHQKDEIDKIVQEMMQSGVIQPSSSSFASPVVLVKKKDGSWRLCVDYRGLNRLTVKDCFHIPLIEDLMDELEGSTVYSKIDLRAGYHQVRMNPEDIYKNAFKTHNGHYEYRVMPFGLTNAPTTFQGLMNVVFQKFLRKFVLIFFDDILIYSKSEEDHYQHLKCVLDVMREQQLFAKRSKCAFATNRVEYLGHFIDQGGVATDPAKIQAVVEWPIPSNVKQLRGFLGLANYYRRFVKNFGSIARPLTLLTKKDSFVWTEDAAAAFSQLKTALCIAPVLALPLFDHQFVVETDACGHGIGAILMQNGHPLAYISRHLQGKQLHLSIYEKELLAVVYAVQKWRHYLLHAHFVIKPDQRSLKYLLEQRLNTPIQQQWLPKLLKFDYEIQYKEGKENLVADALSRVEGSEALHMALSVLECDILQKIQACYDTDAEVKALIEDLKVNYAARKHFVWSRGILRRKSKLVVPFDLDFRNSILQWLHCSGVGGHSRRDATHQRVKNIFYWKGMSKDIQAYIRSCSVCQQCKYDTAASPGLLQPLPIPSVVWSDISMDFIDGLPPSFGKTVIFVVVDRLTKAAHFVALAHPYTAVTDSGSGFSG